MDSGLMALMLAPGKIVDEEQEDDDDPSSSSVPKIAASNREILTLNFSRSVKFNGNRYTDHNSLRDAIVSAMDSDVYLAVSYKLNSEGEISTLEFLEEYTFLQNTKQYNAYEKTFAGSGGAFGLDSKTAALCIPSNDITSNDDYLGRIEMTHKENYSVNAYHYNEDTHCPDVVVFYADMYYNTPRDATDSKKIGLIERTFTRMDDNGDTYKSVVMATGDGVGTYRISKDTSSNADFDSLTKGDLILYSLDSRDQLDGFNRLESCSTIPGDYKTSKFNVDVYSGVTADASYKVVSNNLNKWVDTVTVSGSGIDEVRFEVQKDSTPPIYIWDSRNKTAELGTTDDFLADQKHIIVVKDLTGNLLVRAIVIIQ